MIRDKEVSQYKIHFSDIKRVHYIIITVGKVRHTIKPGTPEHRTLEHGTPTEHRRNTGMLAEHRNSGGTTKHWRDNDNRNTTE